MVNLSNNTHKKLRLDSVDKDLTPKWVVPVMAGGWFTGLLLLFWIYTITDITIWEMLKYLLFFSVLLTLIPYRWIVKYIPIDYPFILSLNLLGFGPILTSLFFTINFLFSSHLETKTAQIIHYKNGEGFNASHTIINLKNGYLNTCPKFRTFDSSSRKQIVSHKYFSYTLSKGCFGFDVLTHYDFTTKPK